MKESGSRCFGSGSPVEAEGRIPWRGRHLVPWLLLLALLFGISLIDTNLRAGIRVRLPFSQRLVIGLEPGGIFFQWLPKDSLRISSKPKGTLFYFEPFLLDAENRPIDTHTIDFLIAEATGHYAYRFSSRPLFQAPLQVAANTLRIRFWFLALGLGCLMLVPHSRKRLIDVLRSEQRNSSP